MSFPVIIFWIVYITLVVGTTINYLGIIFIGKLFLFLILASMLRALYEELKR